jgi:hypothetical protein
MNKYLNKNIALLAIAATVGVQVPTTIETIREPWMKVLAQLLTLLVVTYCAAKIDPSKGFKSLPPGPPDTDITKP